MRYGVFIAAAAILLAAAGPAGAGQRKFEILGGLGDGEPSLPLPGSAGLFGGTSRRIVEFPTELPRGTVIVKTGERRLYYVMHDGRAIMYSVGVGREGFTWSGKAAVSRKAEWPDWRPPREMIEREAERGTIIPEFMAGGPDNPLGARAIYIGDTEYRIHGTSQPWSIGQAVSSGCIRMMNEEVVDLYERVGVGTLVVVE
ncbi:MAG: L,D-transpeptidase [Hyphomicrobiales bacterium]